MTTVSIVDYGLGNLGSVMNMLKRVGASSRLAKTADEIASSDRLILPGIGAFDTGMALLDHADLTPAITAFAATGKPVLGICLGMQLLLDSSEEGSASGLGLIRGKTLRIPEGDGVRVPHMGWNLVEAVRPDPLVAELPADSRFYFVHSYRVVPDDENDVLAITRYGVPFASMIRSENVMGAQYHPEKSHAFGMRVLSNFASL
ncbi:MAG: imidazole glycerol phosphate synthase subunit HisH [Microcella sp.]|uniref:imidazole glycerol phosphate synthase subunit HisH n=1 Tax=Microcella sp. TaxID=1913979 RepID=UPI0024C59D74|nr:imidazole glycerol phosphate synthase subunit HisH [Microcella sp.]UYN82571.1 MAG: imidazole glycerol phosphate synthase subunit HisH [Microcella sp.]